MSPLKHSNNLAARMGRWSASHWKTAVFGWLAFVVASVAIGIVVGQKTIAQDEYGVGESKRGDVILREAGFEGDPQTEFVIVQSETSTVSDPEFRAAVDEIVAAVAPFGSGASATITNLRSPFGHPDQVSPDGRSAIVTWDMKGDYETITGNIDPITAATEKIAQAHPDLYIGEAGSASSGKALDAMFKKQLKQAGERSIPLTLAVLLVVFGSLVAAGVPLLLALSAVIATIGLVALPSQFVPMEESVGAVILLVGLAVGVDYALFYIKREREERAAGNGPRAALEAAAATSGRAVLISGVTVMIAMAGMLFSGDKTYLSFGIATMIVVAVAMIGSLTVLPALLARLGDKIEKGRIPFLRRLRREGGENRFWGAILTPSLRHPAIAAIASASVLIALAIPAFGMKTSQTGLDGLPTDAPTVETINRVQEAFPGDAQPAIVAISADVDSPAVQAAIGQIREQALASGQMSGPIVVEPNAGGTAVRISIPLQGNGTDDAANAALATLRGEILPATIGQVAGAEYAVTGNTAASADANALLKRSAPIVFAFVLTLAFILLLVSFRSVVIAAKAIVLNLLSVGAAYGLLVLVFQHGWGEGLLNFQSNGGIAFWLPIFLFVILFGLSMDYHVFILSRIREAYDRGLSTEEAVRHGIKTTAGTVSAAALVMVGVFSIFATLPIIDMKELGVGLAAAVLIDATIVRAVLLPASMQLLGEWNWWLPKRLEWLPRLEAEGGPAPAPARGGGMQ
jgi:RND superfamily putative drug exporter